MTSDWAGEKREDRMKNKLVNFAIMIIAAMIMFAFGNYLGTRSSLPEEDVVIEKSTVDRVVIVNLDEGTMVNGEKVIYASQLLADIPENFTYSGLEDARMGCANGVYAAYLIIPSTFSRSVVSLNSVPEKTAIQYAIGDNLVESTREKVLLDVVGLIGELNNQVEYMYLYSVLDEVHKVQDQAGQIMENDVDDADAIAVINADDLVEAIPVTPITEVVSDIVPVDITAYMDDNARYAEEMEREYREFSALSVEEQKKILEQSLLLAEEMGNMEGLVSEIDFRHDADDQIITEKGFEEIKQLLDQYSGQLIQAEQEVRAEINSVSGNLFFIQESVKQYDQKMADSHIDIASEIATEIATLLASEYMIISALPLENEYAHVSGDNTGDISGNDQGDVSGSDAVNVSGNELGQALIKVAGPVATNVDNVNPDVSGNNPGDDQESDHSDVSGNNPGSAPGIKSSGVVNQLQIESISLDELTEVVETTLEERYQGFAGYTYEISEAGQTPYWEGDISDFLIAQQQVVADRLDERSVLSARPLNEREIIALVEDKVLSPIEELVERTKTAILDQYGLGKMQVAAYQRSVSDYDPLSLVRGDEINRLTADMYDNGNELSLSIHSVSQLQFEYVAEVYEQSRSDLSAMQDTILAAKETSDRLLTEGLSQAQAIKADNSAENQQLLSGFTKILPYTRLGSVEYQQAYEFMVNPIESGDINRDRIEAENTNANTITSGPVTGQRGGLAPDQLAMIAVGGLSVIGLIAVVRYFMKSRRRAGGEREGYKGYDNNIPELKELL
jgi:uncharacterized phage infection (PIP) family protein YhgE